MDIYGLPSFSPSVVNVLAQVKTTLSFCDVFLGAACKTRPRT